MHSEEYYAPLEEATCFKPEGERNLLASLLLRSLKGVLVGQTGIDDHTLQRLAHVLTHPFLENGHSIRDHSNIAVVTTEGFVQRYSSGSNSTEQENAQCLVDLHNAMHFIAGSLRFTDIHVEVLERANAGQA